MTTPTSAAFITAVAAELASAIEAVSGSPVSTTPEAAAFQDGWTVPLTLSGSLRSHVRLLLDAVGVTALLHVVLGQEADTGEAATRDLLTELTNQAISAACMKPPFTKVVATAGTIVPASPQGDETPLCTLSLEGMTLAIVAATIDAAPAIAPESRAVAGPVPAAAPGRTPAATVATPANLDVVLDIELPLSVRFGSTMMSIRSLSQIGPGSIVDMGRSPDDPVEILVCGRPIARAEVVIVGGNYGVRITDLTSAAERLRAMEGRL